MCIILIADDYKIHRMNIHVSKKLDFFYKLNFLGRRVFRNIKQDPGV